jgi:hypothetical protein
MFTWKEIRMMIIWAIFGFVVGTAFLKPAKADEPVADAPRAAVLITSCNQIVAAMMASPAGDIVYEVGCFEKTE